MSTDILERYNKDGYVIMKNIIPISRINVVLESVIKLYYKYSGDVDCFKSFEEPWNENLLHQKMKGYRKNDPQSFGAIYDILRTNLSLMQLVADDTLVDNVAQRI